MPDLIGKIRHSLVYIIESSQIEIKKQCVILYICKKERNNKI